MKKSILIAVITTLVLGMGATGVVLAVNKSKKGRGGGESVVIPTGIPKLVDLAQFRKGYSIADIEL